MARDPLVVQEGQEFLKKQILKAKLETITRKKRWETAKKNASVTTKKLTKKLKTKNDMHGKWKESQAT